MNINTGNVNSQENYSKTISNFSKLSIWQNANIQINELKDSKMRKRINKSKNMIPALVKYNEKVFESK